MSKAKSGGGATMNKNVKVPIRTGPPNTKAISVSGASHIGRAVGNHASDAGGKKLAAPKAPLVTGRPAQVPMGNQLALNVGKGGVGTGRVNHGQCGSQGQHGPARYGEAPQSQPRDILSQFGPESGPRKG